MKETWKPIPLENLSSRYEVSSHGRVRSLINSRGGLLAAPRMRRLQVSKIGKKVRCSLSYQGKHICSTVSRLVLLAFVGPQPEGCEASHLDGNSENNRLGNLLWETHPENEHRKVAHGTPCYVWSKLTPEKVLELRTRFKNGESRSVLQPQSGVDKQAFRRLITGQSWKGVATP